MCKTCFARISRTSQLRRLLRAGRRPLRRACRAPQGRAKGRSTVLLVADSRAAEARLRSVHMPRQSPSTRAVIRLFADGTVPTDRKHAKARVQAAGPPLTRAYATRQTRRPRATSRSAASSSLPRPELRCRCRSDPGASGWLLPLGESARALHCRSGPIRTSALSGRPGALRRRAPLRTGRARFRASGSSKPWQVRWRDVVRSAR
jgi:hypothetical protein